MKFTYIGVKPDRTVVKGEVEASSEKNARALLESSKLEVMVLQGKKAGAMQMDLNIGRVSDVQLVFFLKHLGIMLKAGLPIFEALVMLKEQSKGKMKIILKKVLQEVSAGQKLSDALQHFPKDFPGLIVELIRAGEMTGTLEANLEYVSGFMRKEIDLKRKVRAAMLYPSIVFLGVIGLVVTIGLFVLPQILPLFSSLDVKLPVTTRILLWFAKFFESYGLLTIVFLIASVFVLPLALENPLSKPISHKLYLRVPIFGNLIKQVNLARFSRSLATMLNAGITIDAALEISINIIKNVAYKKQLRNIKRVVMQGNPMSRALEENPFYFPSMIVHMIRVGERSGNLSDSLNYVGVFYEEELDDKMKNLSTVLEPVLLIFIGVLVAGTALAILGPIYSLTGSLQ